MSRKIPRVAFASLVAGVASACDDPSDAERLASAACRELACEDPTEFSSYYDSLADCRAELTRDYDDYIDDYRAEVGAACTNAMVDYYVCESLSDLDICEDDPTPRDCSDEYDRLVAVCD